jgi:dTDP-4-amino-4,6-dideoxygalactose transaminase
VAARVLNLPLFAAMTDEQQDYVVEALRDAVTATASAAAGR